MGRIAGAHEIYRNSGNMGRQAMLDLYRKVASIYASQSVAVPLAEFCKSPLLWCANALDLGDDKLNAEGRTFLACLRNSVQEWEKAEADSMIKGMDREEADVLDSMCRNFIPKWPNRDIPKINYEKTWTLNGYNWADIDWHFPDSVIARTCNVTRQAAAYRRNQIIGKNKENQMRQIDSYEMTKWAGRHIVLSRNDMLASFTGMDVAFINAISALPVDMAREALSALPNAEPSTWRKTEEEISAHFALHGQSFSPEFFSTIERMQVEKGKEATEICRLLSAAIPNALEIYENALEEKAGIPQGALASIRGLNPDWTERFENIPDVRGANSRLDPLSGLEDSKGISAEEAARLLWIAYAPEIRNNQAPGM